NPTSILQRIASRPTRSLPPQISHLLLVISLHFTLPCHLVRLCFPKVVGPCTTPAKELRDEIHFCAEDFDVDQAGVFQDAAAVLCPWVPEILPIGIDLNDVLQC